MNIFAGNITLTVKIHEIPNLDLDVVGVGERCFFIMGADENISDISSLRQFLETSFGKIDSIDISIEPEDTLEIISSEYEEGSIYECASFEGPDIVFSDILDRFADSTEVICIREAEKSQKFGNRVIKVDFLY